MNEASNGTRACNHKNNEDWIKLNVGGTIFLTTRTTLSKDPESLLCKIINDNLTDLLYDGKVRNCVH